MVIWLLRKVNNVTVVTNVIFHASGMTIVVKVAMGLGNLIQETVSFCQEKHAGSSLFSGRQYTRDVLWIFQKAKRSLNGRYSTSYIFYGLFFCLFFFGVGGGWGGGGGVLVFVTTKTKRGLELRKLRP